MLLALASGRTGKLLDLADEFGVSVDTIRRLWAAGKIRRIADGNAHRYYRDDFIMAYAPAFPLAAAMGRLATSREIAREFGVSQDACIRWHARGLIQRTGPPYRYSRDEVADLLRHGQGWRVRAERCL